MIVVEELTGQAAIGVWTAGRLLLSRPAAWLGLRAPNHVIRNEEVQPAVVVVVQPSGRYRPHLSECWIGPRHAGVSGDVSEAAVAEVAIQNVALDAGHE